MKKFCIIFAILLILTVSATSCRTTEKTAEELPVTEYLRLHVRANSDEAEDQRIKLIVRQEIVNVLSPKLLPCRSKRESVSVLKENIPLIERTATAVLEKNGFSYSAEATLKRETFPLRVYEDITLPSGEYDALVVELGSGKGANWWCVVYPPLCCTGGETVVYRSLLWEWLFGGT